MVEERDPRVVSLRGDIIDAAMRRRPRSAPAPYPSLAAATCLGTRRK
jgi:hypothetical protein